MKKLARILIGAGIGCAIATAFLVVLIFCMGARVHPRPALRRHGPGLRLVGHPRHGADRRRLVRVGEVMSDRKTRKRPLYDHGPEPEPEYRLWVNEARTVLVRLWNSGVMEVATRESRLHTWGPPTMCDEEKV